MGEECSEVFHKGGARLILCGRNWEKLEELADDLAKTSDPTVVRTSLMDSHSLMLSYDMGNCKFHCNLKEQFSKS